MLVRMWTKGNTCTLLVGLLIGATTVENSVEVPQKTKNRTTIWSRNSTSGYKSEENENTNSKRYMHSNIHSRVIYNSQDMEATKCPSIDKDTHTHTHTHTHKMEYYSAIKKILPFATTWMVLEGTMLSGISQRKTNTVCYHLHVEPKK